MKEKPDLRERLGAAFNASDLSNVAERERPSDLIAALGFTQINPDAAEHEEHCDRIFDLAVPEIDPRAELASILMRQKYGADAGVHERAFRLLILWVLEQRAYRRWKLKRGSEGMLEKFVRQGLDEWVHEACRLCNGRKFVGLDSGEVITKRVRCKRCGGGGEVALMPRTSPFAEYGGRPVRQTCRVCHGMGRITVQRHVKDNLGQCNACYGTGMRRASDAERALAVGVEVKVYQRHWARRFGWLGSALDRLDHTEKRRLQMQMEYGIKRA